MYIELRTDHHYGKAEHIWRRDVPWARAAAPATSAAMARGSATSSSRSATMHGAAQAFCRAMTIDAAKSVSFEKKTVLDLKLVYKKC